MVLRFTVTSRNRETFEPRHSTHGKPNQHIFAKDGTRTRKSRQFWFRSYSIFEERYSLQLLFEGGSLYCPFWGDVGTFPTGVQAMMSGRRRPCSAAKEVTPEVSRFGCGAAETGFRINGKECNGLSESTITPRDTVHL